MKYLVYSKEPWDVQVNRDGKNVKSMQNLYKSK